MRRCEINGCNYKRSTRCYCWYIFLFNRFVPVKGVNQITTEELKTKLKRKDIQFVDVRTLGEFTSNHIKSFNNIPLHELTIKSEKLTKDKELLLSAKVVCEVIKQQNC